MTDIPFMDEITPVELQDFENNGYSEEDALDLAKGLLLSAIPCLDTLLTSMSNLDKIAIKSAILEMAYYIKIDYYNFERSTSPFTSETIGSYTYSKMSTSIKGGVSTGVPAFDRAVAQFAGLCDVEGGAGGGSSSTSEIVVRPGFQSYANSREGVRCNPWEPRFPPGYRSQP